MREKAKNLLSKIYSAKYGCIDLVMKAFEDVAVSFAWEMLLGYKSLNYVSVDQLKAGWRDYVFTRSLRSPTPWYPPYKTQVEIVRESMERTMAYISKYPKPKYYKCSQCANTFLDDGRADCPWCRCGGIYHIKPNREKFEKRYYKCLSCDHSFLNVGVSRCPRCQSIHLAHMTQAGYDKEREHIRERISRYYKCCCCDHTFLDIGPCYCPRCKSTTLIPLCKEWKTQSMKDYEKKEREKFLNTYGYVARPGLDLDDGDPDKRSVGHKGLPVGYISYEDMAYLWECMPKHIKYGSYGADAKIRDKVKRILRK